MSTKITSSGIQFSVPTINDFPTTNLENGLVTIVTDANRGGVFVYDSTQSLVNNGGTVFNGWVRQYSGAVNVKWFGAKGDGVTDDTLTIQNAVDCMILKQFSNLYIPSGDYIVSSLKLYSDTDTLRGGWKISGDGRGNIQDTFNSTKITVTNISGVGIDVNYTGVTPDFSKSAVSIVIENITFEGSPDILIRCSMVNHQSDFNNILYIYRGAGVGLSISGCYTSSFRNIEGKGNNIVGSIGMLFDSSIGSNMISIDQITMIYFTVGFSLGDDTYVDNKGGISFSNISNIQAHYCDIGWYNKNTGVNDTTLANGIGSYIINGGFFEFNRVGMLFAGRFNVILNSIFISPELSYTEPYSIQLGLSVTSGLSNVGGEIIISGSSIRALNTLGVGIMDFTNESQIVIGKGTKIKNGSGTGILLSDKSHRGGIKILSSELFVDFTFTSSKRIAYLLSGVITKASITHVSQSSNEITAEYGQGFDFSRSVSMARYMAPSTTAASASVLLPSRLDIKLEPMTLTVRKPNSANSITIDAGVGNLIYDAGKINGTQTRVLTTVNSYITLTLFNSNGSTVEWIAT